MHIDIGVTTDDRESDRAKVEGAQGQRKYETETCEVEGRPLGLTMPFCQNITPVPPQESVRGRHRRTSRRGRKQTGMTGMVVIKSAVTIGVVGAEGIMAFVAVMDPSVANIALTAIGAVVAITTVVFAFKTAKLNALTKKVEEYAVRQIEQEKQLKAQDVKVAEVIKTTDGMKDALVASTAEASEAKGILKEKAAQTVREAETIIAASISSTVQQVVAHEPAALKQIEKHTKETADNTSR